MRNNCEKRKFGFLLIIIFIIILAEEGQIYALSVFTSLLFPSLHGSQEKGIEESKKALYFPSSPYHPSHIWISSSSHAQMHGMEGPPSLQTLPLCVKVSEVHVVTYPFQYLVFMVLPNIWVIVYTSSVCAYGIFISSF